MPTKVATYPSHGLFTVPGRNICALSNSFALCQHMTYSRVHLEGYHSAWLKHSVGVDSLVSGPAKIAEKIYRSIALSSS